MADQEDNQQPSQGNVSLNPNQAVGGMNLNSVLREVKSGQTTYALNAQVENADGNGITYQNEVGNLNWFDFPIGYKVIGRHFIPEQDRIVFWLVNPETGGSEIGVGGSLTNIYKTLINQPCLNHSINHPILKAAHKITACGTEIYWPDTNNCRRYLDIDNLPYAQSLQGDGQNPCQTVTLSTIDCNKLKVQPNFSIPKIAIDAVVDGGNTTEGMYQFAIQYTNYQGDPYTSYYSITNGVPIADPLKVGPDYNYSTGKSIKLSITEIDTTGIYDYFNIAVIKTINNINSVDLVGTYQITKDNQTVIYTGQSKANIELSINDIFEKYVFFDKADDLTTVQDILVWDGLTTNERISYQKIANQIKFQWQSWKIPPSSKGFQSELLSANERGYMRDENMAFDMVVLLKNGYQTDRFPTPGRVATSFDLEMIDNGDVIQDGNVCTPKLSKPRWRVYNTGSVTDFSPEYVGNESNDCYEGPYQYGEFGYWESIETYPCNDAIWGENAGQPIRHHKFPDNSISNHFDSQGNIYPMGLRLDALALYNIIQNSDLTDDQKSQIAQIKIVRADRAANKSIKAKGLIYNSGLYTKDNTTYLYPNYPYNDLREDPFIKGTVDLTFGTVIASNYDLVSTTAGSTPSILYDETIIANTLKNNEDSLSLAYVGSFNGTADITHSKYLTLYINGSQVFKSSNFQAGQGTTWNLNSTIKRNSASSVTITTKITLFGLVTQNTTTTITQALDLTNAVEIKLGAFSVLGSDGDVTGQSETISYIPAPANTGQVSPFLSGFTTDDSKKRFTFHSPDTSFYQPALGSILKLENVQYGVSKSHFVQVKGHAHYKFPSLGSYLTSLGVGIAIGFASGTYGLSDNIFNGSAAFTAFSVFNDIIYKLLPRRNFAYQFNSVGQYNNSASIPNDNGNKIRRLDIAAYLTSGLQSVGDIVPINNYQRESSVFLRTIDTLPFPDSYSGVPSDTSRHTLSQVGCDTGFYENPISAYYASLKDEILDQYGQIYSYQAVDTGFQLDIDVTKPYLTTNPQFYSIFGGDTFINRFAFKRKLPFFLDNRVNFPDDSDVFYDKLGNIGSPTYWFSTDISQGNGGTFGIGALFGVKVNSFDCKDGSFFYDSGKFYLFAYGIPYFYVESQVNVDYRRATNSKEGEYYPHVSSDVPDEWLQEINVPIAQDNTYNYNKSYSKQNNENVFTTLPTNFIPGQKCTINYPNKAIYSDPQADPVYYKKNSWLIYKPVSYFDFPLNYGKLVSLEGIENKEVIARFENRMVVYNSMLILNTSNPQAAYIGNDTLFKSAPPVDLYDTDGGYAGTQHKFFIKTENGHISIDAKRGQIMVIPPSSPYQRRQLKDLAGLEFGVKEFFCENLEFRILKTFPNYPIDNNYNGVGLHGVYDTKYNRLIITKFDWEVTNTNLKYNAITNQFFDGSTLVNLGDPAYFCSRSFTLSFSFLTNSWISFHSYLPNYYVTGPSYFFSGINNEASSFWIHNRSYTLYNNFYGQIAPYILEYPFSYKYNDELVQNVKDYTRVLQYFDNNDYQNFIEVDDVYFNKAILYNNQQNSGLRTLVMKPKNNIAAYLSYPKYNIDSISNLVTKSNSFYNYNGLWDTIISKQVPSFLRDCNSLSIDKRLVQTNLSYSNKAYRKAPLMAKDLKVRHILDNTSDYKLISQFVAVPTQISYK